MIYRLAYKKHLNVTNILSYVTQATLIYILFNYLSHVTSFIVKSQSSAKYSTNIQKSLKSAKEADKTFVNIRYMIMFQNLKNHKKRLAITTK